jgi:hypothetical protein
MSLYGAGLYGARLYGAGITVTALNQAVWPARVLVTVSGLTVGETVTLYRSVGGIRTAVRDAADVTALDTNLVRTDAELPYGVPVTYIAVTIDQEFTSSAVTYTLVGGKVAITDAVNGNAAEVVILAWPTKQRERKGSTYVVGGRTVVVSGPLASSSGQIELFTEYDSSRDTLYGLLEDATAGVVQLRQPGGYAGVDGYYAVVGVGEVRWSQDGSDQRRRITLDVTEVEPWATGFQSPGTTLQDIADTYTGLTLAAIATDYATLLLLAQGSFV